MLRHLQVLATAEGCQTHRLGRVPTNAPASSSDRGRQAHTRRNVAPHDQRRLVRRMAGSQRAYPTECLARQGWKPVFFVRNRVSERPKASGPTRDAGPVLLGGWLNATTSHSRRTLARTSGTSGTGPCFSDGRISRFVRDPVPGFYEVDGLCLGRFTWETSLGPPRPRIWRPCLRRTAPFAVPK